MMQRPPYVPKLHSSQILTRVSGRTYESQTGLSKIRQHNVCFAALGGGGLTIFRRISHKDGRWLPSRKRGLGQLAPSKGGGERAHLFPVGVCT